MLHWQSGASGVEIHPPLFEYDLLEKQKRTNLWPDPTSFDALTAVATSICSIWKVRMSSTHVIQVDAVSTFPLELRIRTIRNCPSSRQEPCRLRGAQCWELIRTVRTIRQTVAKGRIDEFQLTRTTVKSSIFTPRLNQPRI
jgi:hypothetical protein